MKNINKRMASIIIVTAVLLMGLVISIITEAKYVSDIQGNGKDLIVSSTYKTVLYNDGTFIINEPLASLNKDEHDGVKAMYEPLNTVTPYIFDESEEGTAETQRPWKSEVANIKNVQIGSPIEPTSTAYWFSGMNNESLTSIELSDIDTSSVTDMSYMFNGCSSLTSVAISDFNTQSVTNMSHMFSGCSALASVPTGDFDTEFVADMSYMFNGCSSLTSITTTNFDTTAVTDMSGMFKGCSSLESINIDTFRTSRVTSIKEMFSGCQKLSVIDVTKMFTASVRDFSDLFKDCATLGAPDVTNFETGLATNMSGMFSGCSNMSSVDVSGFITSNVTDMSNMFNGCSKLTQLDLRNFYTENVTDMTGMFSGASKLQTIVADVEFVTTGLDPTTQEMFKDCAVLEGGEHTKHSEVTELPDSSVYARIDQGPISDAPGYFTEPDPELWYGISEDGKTLYLSARKTDNAPNENIEALTATKASDCEWDGARADITKVIIENIKDIKPFSTSYWFSDMPQLTAFQNLELLNTKNVATMTNMFAGDSSLTSLDLHTFDTKAVTDMSGMFTGCSSMTTVNVQSFNTANVQNMSGMFADCSVLTGVDLTGFNTSNVTNMQSMFRNDAQLTGNTLKVSALSADKLEDTSYMFQGCSSLDTLILGTGFDTKLVNDMQYMFDGCSNLLAIKTGSSNARLNTANAEKLNNMFSGCSKLAAVDTTNFNTAKATTTSHMFDGCETLTTLDTSNFIGSAITDASYMFKDCSKVTALDLKKLAPAACQNMQAMFQGCSLLGTLSMGSDFDTGSVTNMNSMFKDCVKVNADIEVLKTGNVEDFVSMFEGCTNVATIDVSNFDTSSATNMARMFDGCKTITELNVSGFDTTGVGSFDSMFAGCSKVSMIDVSGFKTTAATNMAAMFADCSSVIELAVDDFNTASVTTMAGMFNGCEKLEILEVSNFDTSSVNDMTEMFAGCSKLATIYATDKFVTTGVVNSDDMFAGCENLEGGKGTHWNENYQTDKTYARIDQGPTSDAPGYFTQGPSSKLFYGFNADKTVLYLSPIQTEQADMNGVQALKSTGIADIPWHDDASTIESVEIQSPENGRQIKPMSTAYWFCDLLNISTITGIENITTSNVINMTAMFCECEKLSSLDISQFDTSNVTDMSAMFQGCKGLTDLDVSKFETKNVTSMAYMFLNCEKLTTLDLSNFNTGSVTATEGMFDTCKALTTIYATDSFVTTGITSSGNMFNGCAVLVGGQGTEYAKAGVKDKEYAKVDRVIEGKDPGYFTDGTVADIYWGIKTDDEGITTLYISATKTEEAHFPSVKAPSAEQASDCEWDAQRNNINRVEILNTISPSSTAYWFQGMQNCMSITGTEKIDTHSLTNTAYMFANDSALREINLGDFNTSKVIDMTGMFAGDYSLVSIYSSFDFDVTSLAEGKDSNMFQGCENLIGGQGTPFDVNKIDSQYALIDHQQEDGGVHGYLTDTIPISADLWWHAKFNAQGKAVLYISPVKCLDAPIPDISGKTVESAQPEDCVWNNQMYRQNISNIIVLNDSKTGDKLVPSSMAYWFTDMDQCETIEGLDNIDTSSVENMAELFAEDSALKSIDISSFETANVTDMTKMFYNNSSLDSLDLSALDTSSVESMESMLNGCSKVTELDVSGFDTSNVTSMGTMFANNPALKTIFGSELFVTDQVTDGDNMFENCSTNLKGSNGTTWSAEHIDKDYAWIDGRRDLDTQEPRPGYFTGGNLFWMIDSDNVLHIRAEQAEGYAENYSACTSSKESSLPWDSLRNTIAKVVFEGDSEHKVKSFSTAYWFSHMSNCLEIQGFENFDGSNTVRMNSMFVGSEEITELNFGAINTSKVTNYDNMFKDCIKLKTILSVDFKTVGATGNNMFLGCTVLAGSAGTIYSESHTGLDYAHLDDSANPGYFSDINPHLWYKISGNTLYLAPVDLGGYTFDDTDLNLTGTVTPKWLQSKTPSTYTEVIVNAAPNGMKIHPTGMANWFKGMTNCAIITGLENLDTSMVTSFNNLFDGCTNITSLDLSAFDTSNATDFSLMFNNCSAITYLSVPTFDTSKAKKMDSMFAGMTQVLSIDITNFSTDAGPTTPRMFGYCDKLIYIYASEKFDKEKITGDTTDMFAKNTSSKNDIEGGNGTRWDQNYTDKTYACIDHWDDKGVHGYFRIDSPDLYWKLDANNGDNVLHISPLALAGYTQSTSTIYSQRKEDVAWNNNRNAITKVVIESGPQGEKIKTFSTSYWFTDLVNCSEITGFENLYTNNAETMVSMFEGCSNIKELDLGIYYTNRATDYTHMFYNCSKLEKITSSNFKARGTVGTDMFKGCIKLAGEEGTEFSNVYTGVTYARIDKAQSSKQPGYFYSPPRLFYKLDDNYVLHLSPDEKEGYINNDEALSSAAPADCKWHTYRSVITGVSVESGENNEKILPTSMAFWFKDLMNPQMTTIDGLENIDTSKVIDFHETFSEMRNVVDIDLSSWDTSSAKSMWSTFFGMNSVKYFDLSNLNTSNVVNMRSTLQYVTSATIIDVRGWDTRNVKNLTTAFCDNKQLETIYASSSFVTSSVVEGNWVFSSCSTKLRGGAGTTWSSSNTSFTYARIDKGTSAKGYFTEKPFLYWKIDSDNSLHISPVKKKGYTPDYWSSTTIKTPTPSNIPWYSQSATIVKDVIEQGPNGEKIQPQTIKYWFYYQTKVSIFDGLKNIDDTNLKDTSYTFSNCSSLKWVDISGLNFAKVTNNAYMFNNCQKLETIYATTDALSKISSNYTFTNCSAIRGGAGTTFKSGESKYARIDKGPSSAYPGYFTQGPGPETSKLFYGFGEGNTVLYISPVETEEANMNGDQATISKGYEYIPWYNQKGTIKKVIIQKGPNGEKIKPQSMAYWFDGGNDLFAATSIEGLENIDGSQLTDMHNTFCRCQNLTSLDISGLDTSHVTTLEGTFSRLSKVGDLDLSSMDTSSVTSMKWMMDNCTSLKTLNIAGWNFAKATDISYMMENCTSLVTVYASGDVPKTGITGTNMFNGCTQIKGGAGTTYVNGDLKYATIDKGPSSTSPGYFTAKTSSSYSYNEIQRESTDKVLNLSPDTKNDNVDTQDIIKNSEKSDDIKKHEDQDKQEQEGESQQDQKQSKTTQEPAIVPEQEDDTEEEIIKVLD